MGFNITHGVNQWSKEEKAIEFFYLTKFFYLTLKRKRGTALDKRVAFNYQCFQRAVDWQSEAFNNDLKNGRTVAVPHSMTNFFQPFDLTVNRSCRSFLQNKEQTWYADQVQSQIARGIAPESVSLNLEMSTLKALHVKWITQYFNLIRTVKKLWKTYVWKRAGITKTLRDNNKGDPFEH